MSTKQQPRRIVLASGNPGKVAEFNALLSDWHWEVLPQSAFAVAEIEEDGDSFVENALLKAHNAAQHSGLPALADDSGLAVDALDGAPGIYSARFAGVAASDADNNHKLVQELQDLPADQRSASFHCALVFLRHWQDPNPIICQARWQGQILAAAAGENGFGYDPLFYVPEQECSAAQLPSELKNRISHRGQALQKLLTALRQEYL